MEIRHPPRRTPYNTGGKVSNRKLLEAAAKARTPAACVPAYAPDPATSRAAASCILPLATLFLLMLSGPFAV